MADRPDDLRAGGRSAGPPPHPFQALRLTAVVIAQAGAALIARYRDSLGSRELGHTHTNGRLTRRRRRTGDGGGLERST